MNCPIPIQNAPTSQWKIVAKQKGEMKKMMTVV
jgi:hypothetical protein